MDNAYLQQDIKQRSKIDRRILEAQYKYGLVLVGLSLLQEDDNELEETGITKYDMIEKVTRKVAPMLLPMIHDLGILIAKET